MRGALHRLQRDLEGCLKTFGGRSCNRARSGSGKHGADEIDRFTRQIGDARGETRMFKQPNSRSQRRQIFRCHGRTRPCGNRRIARHQRPHIVNPVRSRS